MIKTQKPKHFTKTPLSEYTLKNVFQISNGDKSLPIKEYNNYGVYDHKQVIVNSYKIEQACFINEFKKALKQNKQLSLVYKMNFKTIIEKVININYDFKKNYNHCDFVLLNKHFFYTKLLNEEQNHFQQYPEFTHQFLQSPPEKDFEIFDSKIIGSFQGTEFIINSAIPYNLVICFSNSCMIKGKKETQIKTINENLFCVQKFGFKIKNLQNIIGFSFVDNLF